MKDDYKTALKSMDKIQWYEADFEEYCESGWDVQDSGYFVNDHYKTIRSALILSKAIKGKRVLLVPVEPTPKMLIDCGTMDNYYYDHGLEHACADQDHISWYKAMTQAVDTEKLIKEITE